MRIYFACQSGTVVSLVSLAYSTTGLSVNTWASSCLSLTQWCAEAIPSEATQCCFCFKRGMCLAEEYRHHILSCPVCCFLLGGVHLLESPLFVVVAMHTDGEDEVPKKRTNRNRSSKKPSPYG